MSGSCSAANDGADLLVAHQDATSESCEPGKCPADSWWGRDDLNWHGAELVFAGRRLQSLAEQLGTRTFLYSASRVQKNVDRLYAAARSVGLGRRFRINFAMKANRFAPLLTFLRLQGQVGIDACSPNEVEHAMACGFEPELISFTGTSLSREDFDRLTRLQGLRVNLDCLRSIDQWGERLPGATIGIRINPGEGVSRADNDKLSYCGSLTTKFGVYREHFAEALRVAARHGLRVDTIHFHTGCGYLTPQLDQWERVLEASAWFCEQIDGLQYVNVGGGLGVPHLGSDAALDLDRWIDILNRHMGRLDGVILEVEPGDYLVKDAGVLLLTVSYVERKRDVTFVGVNGGFNLAVEPAVYGLPFQPVPAVQRPGEWQTYTIAGHINEALDIWYPDLRLPPLAEQDTLVLLNAGAYSSSMASNHCMRGEFREFLLTDNRMGV